jgi:uncharacterized protein (TIGR00251 family)
MQIPFRKTRDGISLQVKVQPRSSRKGIEGVAGDTVKVYLTSPPAEGAANAQLIEVLSEALGVRKSAIHIIKGLSSRLKLIEIKGVEKI